MNYSELLQAARDNIGGKCSACPVCNGRACGNRIPGPGAKGTGDTAARNYDWWQKIRVNMDTLVANGKVDMSTELFGKKMRLPLFAGPVGVAEIDGGVQLGIGKQKRPGAVGQVDGDVRVQPLEFF